jgi:hypothetical protein
LLPGDDVALLRRSGPLTWQRKRLGLLWVVAPFSIFTDRANGFRPVIRKWGGEAIGWTDTDEAATVVDRFTGLSVPAIIEVAVPVGDFPVGKELWPVAVGSLLDLREPGNEWGVEVSVPQDRVVGIIHPGDPRWPERLRA